MPANYPARPALDLLAELQGLAQSEGYEGFLSGNLTTIGQIIATQDEARARSELLHIRGNPTNQAYLEESWYTRLDAALNPTEERSRPSTNNPRRQPTTLPPRISGRVVAALTVSVLALILVIFHQPIFNSLFPQSGPPAGTSQQAPPPQEVPPDTTDLQNFKTDWGPWKQITPSDQAPITDGPALLLIENGGVYVSENWTVAPTAPIWQPDIGGNVSNVRVDGKYIRIVDVDGNPANVEVNQPFVVSTNPGTVIRIDGTGEVWTTTSEQAATHRIHL